MKAFSTPEYHGVWFDYEGDRLSFRACVQNYLRENLNDPKGALLVDGFGPRWEGEMRITLSYSHTEGKAILVHSNTHALGVDLECEDRAFSLTPLELATRFFHASESDALQKMQANFQKDYFLKLWVKKEAYAKWTRLGLGKTLGHALTQIEGCKMLALPVVPKGYLGAVAFSKIAR